MKKLKIISSNCIKCGIKITIESDCGDKKKKYCYRCENEFTRKVNKKIPRNKKAKKN
jgi:hypothetical protein